MLEAAIDIDQSEPLRRSERITIACEAFQYSHTASPHLTLLLLLLRKRRDVCLVSLPLIAAVRARMG